jgi:hypothetical protein
MIPVLYIKINTVFTSFTYIHRYVIYAIFDRFIDNRQIFWNEAVDISVKQESSLTEKNYCLAKYFQTDRHQQKKRIDRGIPLKIVDF